MRLRTFTAAAASATALLAAGGLAGSLQAGASTTTPGTVSACSANGATTPVVSHNGVTVAVSQACFTSDHGTIYGGGGVGFAASKPAGVTQCTAMTAVQQVNPDGTTTQIATSGWIDCLAAAQGATGTIMATPHVAWNPNTSYFTTTSLIMAMTGGDYVWAVVSQSPYVGLNT